MHFEDFCPGMHVRFGRPNGEKTNGFIVKMTSKKAHVETTEARGQSRGSKAGTVWQVPYSLMEPVGEPAKTDLKYVPYESAENRHILMAILACYAAMSPENLTADGELPVHAVIRRRVELERKIKGLCDLLGRNVSEAAIYAWDDDRRAWEKKYAATQ